MKRKEREPSIIDRLSQIENWARSLSHNERALFRALLDRLDAEEKRARASCRDRAVTAGGTVLRLVGNEGGAA